MHITEIAGQYVTSILVSVVRDMKLYFLPFKGLLFGRICLANTVELPSTTNLLPVIRTSWSGDTGGLAEPDGLMVDGSTMVLSADGSGGSN